MKIPLLGLAAFVAGVAGGTGLGVTRAPAAVETDAEPTAEAVVSSADSTPESRPDSVTPPADSSGTAGHGAPVNPAPDPSPGASVEPPRAAPVPAHPVASPADVARAYDDVARILLGMKADDAGKILAYLTDAQFEGLVRQVGPRQASKLLTLAPAERAGSLSRRLLEHPGRARP